MAIEIEADRNIFILDTEMFGLKGYGSLYIIRALKPAIIETGFSYTLEKTLTALEELKIAPEEVAYICPTHVHMDHAGGAGTLAQALPNAKVIVHERGAPHLIEPTKLIASVKRAVGALFPFYGEMIPVPKEQVIAVKGGERFELGDGYLLEVIDSPGHAPHHVCFYEQKTKGLFTGDAVGIYQEEVGFIMTTPPPSFHFEESLITLERLRRLELKWLYFTHFGAQPRPYELIDKYEGRLRSWVEGIAELWRELGDEQAIKEHFIREEERTLGRIYSPEALRQEVEMNVTGVLLYLKRQHHGSDHGQGPRAA
jgi:glyoxylase-like metal-dependent hydrolase (beta-lactamase superfamily II)